LTIFHEFGTLTAIYYVDLQVIQFFNVKEEE